MAKLRLGDIEAGKGSLNAITIEKICLALNVTITEFFAEERPQLEPELRRLVDTARKAFAETNRISSEVTAIDR